MPKLEKLRRSSEKRGNIHPCTVQHPSQTTSAVMCAQCVSKQQSCVRITSGSNFDRHRIRIRKIPNFCKRYNVACSPVSHRTPVYPATQVQVYPFTASRHDPPLTHGLLAHSFISTKYSIIHKGSVTQRLDENWNDVML